MSRLYFILLFVFLGACVKPKVYKTELATRQQCQAREQVYQQELSDRKKETATLTQLVADLNRKAGNQEAELRILSEELVRRTQQMGESTVQIIKQKEDLERDLAQTRATLLECQTRLATFREIAAMREGQVNALEKACNETIAGFKTIGVNTTKTDNSVTILIPDKALFDNTGSVVSANGKKLLTSIAAIMAVRPSLDIEIQAHTDNALPTKEKSLKDTWEWSLLRAVNVTRILVLENGVNANQLTPVGKGEFYPLTSNETEEGRRQNRRTLIVLLPDLKPWPGNF
jgi:chemotaxis protein MotB